MEALSLSNNSLSALSLSASHEYMQCNDHQTSRPDAGVFGVDARKRINMWNDAAAAVTGVSLSSTSDELLGKPFEYLFPVSSFYLTASVSLVGVVEDVISTGKPVMGLNVHAEPSMTRRKRNRDGAKTKPLSSSTTASTLFSVDLLPQFDTTPSPHSSINNKMTVTGVVLVCTNKRNLGSSFAANDVPSPTPAVVSLHSSTQTLESAKVSEHQHRTTPSRTRNSKTSPILELPAPPLYCDKAESATTILNKALEEPAANSDKDEDEDCYRTIFDTIDTVIFGVDHFGMINEWNHRMTELTGIPKEEFLGLSFYDDKVVSALYASTSCRSCPHQNSRSFREEMEPVLANAFDGRSTSKFHLSLHCKKSDDWMDDGDACECEAGNEEELRHFLASISPRYNAQREIVGAVFVALDTTDFCTIKATANELRKLIDTANAPIFGIDANGYVNEWNDKTAEITGYRKEDAFGCLLVDTFIFPDIHASIQGIFKDALHHGKGTSNYELEFRTKSNEIRHLLVNITPQCDMNNAVVGAVLIAQDVTEAVNRDRAVANMALELRQLIDTANAPIFGIDVHGKVNEWNTRMTDITGYSKEEAIHIPLVGNFIATSMQEKVGEILEAALNGNETSNYEVEVTSKSGEPIFLLVNATTRRDPDANVTGVVGVAQDVTEDRKHAKALREMQTLRASQEAKVETERNMTAYFAHELRNPLGAIDSALAAMPDNLPDSAQTLVSGMQLCTKFMASIMNNLLDVRKMEEGKMRLGKAPVSIRNILHNVHKMLTPSVRPGVNFRKLINVKGNSWVIGDAHRIEQVFTNVVSNAIKYTVSGHIQISIEWEGENLKFVCEDTGPGIPKSEQAKLFQRFVQRGGAPGTGLGLAIAKHIVDLTGGSIRFESDPTVKAGTTCIVLMALPICKAPDNIAEKKVEMIQEPISVLVIDDIKMNRTMMKRRISKAIAPNATIKEAATGEDALLICGQEKFDVMIVDQFMEEAGGVMVGTDVVFAMRRMRIDSIIIGCSGNDIGTQFFDAGADMVWQKPMPTNDQIIQDLRSALDKHKSN